ncbi:MAG: chromosomal replication initiator protein DnaA [Defluviitaleaceae bacterium]|nr:chromosomal replication initiator protein DnaA [Defluviitaleaceae bacterium]
MEIGSVEKLWEDIKASMSDGGFNPAAFNSWITPIRPYEVNEREFVVLAKNQHVLETAGKRYHSKIVSAVKQVTGRDLKVVIKLESDIENNEETKTPSSIANNANLRPKFHFDSFVKGKSNEFAYAAAMAVAEEPGIRYNPLFLHGDVGLGKTHLVHSIGNHILYNEPDAKILYTSSENLVNEFIGSIRNKKNQEFRDKYRTVDVLLVDDIQFLSDKEGTQEEFFHTFNALHNDNKQIVLTSDKPPHELKSLEDRLRSRFGSGLTVDITLPDLETRIAILEKKAEMERMDVDREVIYYIAKVISSNIRELEGALNTVTARAKLTNNKCTVDFAERTLADMINQNEKRELNVEYIQEVVAAYYSITHEEICSKKRTKTITYARHVAMYLSRMILHRPLKDIGVNFGGRDHSTIVHACDKITAELEDNQKLQKEIEELEKRIKGD